MLHSIDPSILFLQEEDVIKAGALDMKMTLAAVEETYKLLGQGQIINPPKTHIAMPIGCAGKWDSFFNTMPCYLGGDIDIGGVKWAAESNANAKTPGIPYGIDITILSDPKTVLPFCILDGTLITAMRTAAVAGVFAKYTAPENTKTVTLVGAGVVGRCGIMATCEALPQMKKLYVCDLDVAKAEALVEEYKTVYPNVEMIATGDTKAACAESEILIAATTSRTPYIHKDWLKPGMTMVVMSSGDMDVESMEACDTKMVDYWTQMKTFKNKGMTALYEAGKLADDEVIEMSDIVLGKWTGRKSAEEIICCSSMGLGALDIMIGYKLFENAQKMGIGKIVKMWDKPLWE